MTENGYEYVDLGLPSKTMWATCNVGADKPEDEGLLFQFGRVDGYKYGDKNHKFKTKYQNLLDGSSSVYTPVTTSGKVYKANDILDLADDAAHVNMGGKWMMPTNDQLKELHKNTKHEIERIDGIKGMLFTSNINNNQLFVPFTGFWHNDNFIDAGINTSIWYSQIRASSTVYAYRIYCSSGNGVYTNNFYYRSDAYSVRGVFKSNDTSNEYKNNINMLI